MRNPIEAEDLRDSHYSPLTDPVSGPVELRNTIGGIIASYDGPEARLLDGFVTAVKWVFLYLPGAAAIHFVMMGFALLFVYKNWSFEFLTATAGFLIFPLFMTMFGIEKLSDLRYLRVPAAIAAAGALSSILYSILIVFIPGDFFGLFTLLTLPLALIAGYVVKKDTDRKTDV